jgi:hypothetical protein
MPGDLADCVKVCAVIFSRWCGPDTGLPEGGTARPPTLFSVFPLFSYYVLKFVAVSSLYELFPLTLCSQFRPRMLHRSGASAESFFFEVEMHVVVRSWSSSCYAKSEIWNQTRLYAHATVFWSSSWFVPLVQRRRNRELEKGSWGWIAGGKGRTNGGAAMIAKHEWQPPSM